jgi:hypothetical protein
VPRPERQEDKPPRSEAIRRLVELGLTVKRTREPKAGNVIGSKERPESSPAEWIYSPYSFDRQLIPNSFRIGWLH